MAGLVFRLLLALPGDLYARVLAAEADGRMPAGSFASWLASPGSQASFMKHFVLATCWLGAVFGALVLWRRGVHKIDVAFGGIAGAVAGLAGSATFACILPALDALPRFLWHAFAVQVAWTGYTGAAWVWTPVWIAFAAAIWTLAGAGIGFVLGRFGRPGSRMLGSLGELLSWVFRLCGLSRAAAYFAAR